MMAKSRIAGLISRNLFVNRSCRHSPAFKCRHTSTDASSSSDSLDKNLYDKFWNDRVQKELEFLTGLNYDKVFRVYKTGKTPPMPSYQFLTEKQLKSKMNKIRIKAIDKLQMPPVLPERKSVSQVIDEDPNLIGLNSCKMVFTDITYGVHDRERLIVVREPDGTLRTAEWDERDRLNQIYFPKQGRRVYDPPMFDNLEKILDPEKYEYILAATVQQFEPDHPVYLKTVNRVYEHVDQHREYDVLHSTRFYGPMVYNFVLKKKCDNLIVYYFSQKKMESVVSVLQVYGVIHDVPELLLDDINDRDSSVKIIEHYIEKVCSNRVKINTAFRSMIELIQKEKETQQDILKSHSGSDDN